MVDLKIARKGIEMLYTGKCTIEELRESEDPKTGILVSDWIAVVTDQACRRSFKTINTVDSESGAAKIVQIIKLFVAPEIEVKAGSRITVTQDNKTETYKRAGIPAVRVNHQEVILEIEKKWA